MLHNRFNPLLSPHNDTPPAHSGSGISPEPETAPEKETGDEARDEVDPEPKKEIETPQEPAPPAESAKINAFQRTAMRALGTGALVARVERAEAAEHVALAEITRLKTENIRLTSELSKLQNEMPGKIAEAQKVREKEVSTGVLNELGKIGISEKEAPSQITAEQSDKIMTRTGFNAMGLQERGKFMRDGGKLID
jgi:hypothetical protein